MSASNNHGKRRQTIPHPHCPMASLMFFKEEMPEKMNNHMTLISCISSHICDEKETTITLLFSHP